MPYPTPLHTRTAALCASLAFKDWSGYHAVRRYDTYVDREYYAIRHAAGLLDVSPLQKYEVTGPDAARLLARVMVRDVTRLSIGRVWYTCWCDDDGHVLDDGTVTRLDERRYRVTSALPALAWLRRHARGLDVEVEDVSRSLAALALQGPRARDVLAPLVDGDDLASLRFFGARPARLATTPRVDATVTRTGYTGDLGYEVWIAADDAVAVWDALLESGRPHRLLPVGLDALDVVRVEAGFVLLGVDYFSARDALIEAHTSTPAEIGLGWMVKLDRAGFVGREALLEEAAHGGPRRRLVGLEIDWDEFEALHEELGLPPHLAVETCREGVPLYHDGRAVGQATSRTWSPTLKRYLGLGTLPPALAHEGSEVEIEVTVEYRRRRATARVASTPFFPPDRMRA